MIGRTNVGGGGAELNFEVVGGTSAPASPKENTIWVNTDTEITSWVFSAKRPIDLVDSYYVSDSTSQYSSALLVTADLKPDTTYTMTFEGVAGQKFYVNENFASYKSFAVTSGRNTVTFTTKSELSTENTSQYVSRYGWVVLKNTASQTSAPSLTKLRMVEGDKDIDPSGMVWIYTGAASAVEFNALKKNSIQVYPMSAKQYVDGAWVDKIAKSYLDGAWNDWAYFIYRNGVFHDGGSVIVTDTTGYGSFTAESDAIRVLNNSGSEHSGYYLQFTKAVDMTNKKTAQIIFRANADCSQTPGTDSYAIMISMWVSTANGKRFDWTDPHCKLWSVSAGQTYEMSVDVSALSGNYYIHCGVYDSGNSTGYVDIDITEVFVA